MSGSGGSGGTSFGVPANPISALVAIAGPLVALVVNLARGCGQTCIATAGYADDAQRALSSITNQYFSIPESQRTPELQRKALEFIQQILTALARACGQPGLGSAGRRCIEERLIEGGQAPWCPNPDHRGCDWVTAFYNPIKNDPAPARNTSRPATGAVSQLPSGASFQQVAGATVQIGSQAVSMGVIMLVFAAIFLIFIA